MLTVCTAQVICLHAQTCSLNMILLMTVYFFFFHVTDATCLLNSGIVHLTCSGYQKEVSLFCYDVMFVYE